jgi:hypothetical protein
MSARRLARALIGMPLTCSSVACRDVGIVGEGSACKRGLPERRALRQRCVCADP